MKRHILSALAMALMAQSNADTATLAPPTPILPVLKTTSVNPTDFGIYMANKRTHKHYLRTHHLGKFAKHK